MGQATKAEGFSCSSTACRGAACSLRTVPIALWDYQAAGEREVAPGTHSCAVPEELPTLLLPKKEVFGSGKRWKLFW